VTKVASETAAALLEREPELKEFGNTLAEARQGRGRVVFVEAPAGLGKTTLLNAASERGAKEGFLCLRARATELERDFAYGCVRQLLEPAAATASDSERNRLFEGAAALSEPLFTQTATGLESPAAESATSIRHGLYWLLNNLADDVPVVLSIDDLHWADAESVRFLNYLGPRLDGLPLAVLTSTRTGETVTADIARLATGPSTTILRPRPLSIEATAAFCQKRLGAGVAEDFAAACHDATGGNPFFLEALLRQTSEQGLSTDSGKGIREQRIGPREVAQAVLLRLTGAPPSATALVRAVAVLGDGANLVEAADLVEIPEEEVAREADRLAALEIFVPGERLEFAHPIVREAVYADIGPHERADTHARAARILAASGASEERVAAQVTEAEPTGDPLRVELLRRVAAESIARAAPSGAVALLSRALAEPPPVDVRAQVQLELGTAELRLGKPEAAGHLEEALGALVEPEPVARAARELANARAMPGDYDGMVAALSRGIDRVEGEDPELALLLEAEMAAKALQGGTGLRQASASRLKRHTDLEGATPGERLVLASIAYERARASESEREAAALIEEALAGGQLLSEQDTDVAGPFYVLVRALLCTDALDLARESLDQGLGNARHRGSMPATAYVLTHRAWCSLLQGLIPRAEADARTALGLLDTEGIRLGAAFALAGLLLALIERGELDQAERELAESSFAEEIPTGLVSNNLLEARARIHLACGRPREALQDVFEFGRTEESLGAANPLASRWRSIGAQALDASGDRKGAERMADDDLDRARRWGAASGIGIALRARGLVDDDAGRSLEFLDEAVKALRLAPARLEHARALVDLGAALRRANRRADARRDLEQGLALAERCGGLALAERARTELRAAGGPTSDPLADGIGQLTASELRVASLAAQGQSNPEIAQSLFVTRKTVETHLGHVYSKLGISGRGELEDALADRVPDD
jgi:DNA-binding CsgD family transcriptional regulator